MGQGTSDYILGVISITVWIIWIHAWWRSALSECSCYILFYLMKLMYILVQFNLASIVAILLLTESKLYKIILTYLLIQNFTQHE